MQSSLVSRQVGQANQNIKADLDSLTKTTDNKKKTINALAANAKLESSEKTKDTENLMETLSQDESQSMTTSGAYAQANEQSNRLSGLQAYGQSGKSVFNFA